MLQYFSSDWIFPVRGAPIKHGVVAAEPDGTIVKVFTAAESKGLVENVPYFKGAIVPGFINTHCHLELSHLKGVVPKSTGLVDFVQNIIKSRGAHAAEAFSAMQLADTEMYTNGIVAVGDISNTIDSKATKESSKIYYHTFVEAMGFHPGRAAGLMDRAMELKAQFSPLPASVVPHAPYSVSGELFDLINAAAKTEGAFLSIHNQEAVAENAFFETKTGDFLKLYEFLGLDIDFFKPTGSSSVKSYLHRIPGIKMALVHNTFSDRADVDFAMGLNEQLYWCLCPSANLYIENSLPDVEMLIDAGAKVTLGTDSLASNDRLNLLDEMMVLQDKKAVGFEPLLQWATINGAEFLGLQDRLGTIEAGKRPGLNLIQLEKQQDGPDADGFKIIHNSARRLI